jgi:hypothetical protein
MSLQHRILGHRRVQASTLARHPLNARLHGAAQRSALRALLEEIGLARSVLAYVSDADRAAGLDRLTLIDGHLRQEELGEEEVEVEILDVNDAEARALLLSLDPLAQLADYDRAVLDRLRAMTSTSSDALANLWASIDAANAAVQQTLASRTKEARIPEQFLILVECADEATQRELLERFQAEGLKCKALMS